jgi:tyrosine-protein kinase Etk/Wzc
MLFIVKTLIRRWKFILTAGIVTAAVMAAVSFVLPKWYTATASMFPPEPKTLVPSYADIMQSLQLPILGPSASGARPNTIYVEILLSRTIGEKLVDEFNLKERYGAKRLGEAITELHSRTTLSLLENGLLTISYEDTDPKQAAAIANRYIALLDEYNRTANITRASKTREFIESQMAVHSHDLRQAEEDLKAFEENNQALELTEQIRSAIELVSNLTAQAVSLEIDLEILRQYTSKNSEEYLRKKKQYDEVLGQLEKFKTDSARSENDVVRSFFPTFDKIPQVTLDYARLFRRVNVEEKVFQMLTTEYEKARIEEARDTPTVQILDSARVPEIRSRPRRKILVFLGAVLGVAWSSLFVLLGAYWREGSGVATFRDVVSPVVSDVRRFLRKKP